MNHATNHDNHYGQPAGAAVSDRMRELLARAARDHDDEQRTYGVALDEIQQRLEGVEWVLQDVREREIGNLSGRLTTMSGQLDELAEQRAPEWAQRLADQLEGLGEKIKPIAELPSLWADVGVITESVDEALGRLQTLVDAGEGQARRFDDVCQRLERLQHSIDAASARFSRLDKALTTLTDRTEQLERGIEAVGQRTDNGLESTASRIEGTSGRIDGLDGRLDGVQGRLDGVDNRLGSVHERLEHLPAALETPQLHRRLNELAERPLPDPTERLAALDERLSEAESHLTEVVDGIGQEVRSRPGRTEVEETVSKVVESAQQQSGQRLASLEESVIALAEVLLSRGVADAGETRDKSSRDSKAGSKTTGSSTQPKSANSKNTSKSNASPKTAT